MKIAEVLMNDGIMPNLKGFEFLLKAIAHTQENPNAKICKMYEEIGNECGSTSDRAERAIRHAISHSLKVKPKIESLGRKSDNGTYINYVAYCLSHEIEIF